MTTLEAFIVVCVIFLILGSRGYEEEERRRNENGL